MQRFQNHSLKDYNTFRIDVAASEFIIIENKEELLQLYKENIFNEKFLIIGEASNILFTQDFDGTVIKIDIQGFEITSEDENYIYVKAAAGEDWDHFVEMTIEKHAYGLENLSLIPGSVGASAVQNIGAYGVEAKDFIESVEYFNIEDGQFHTLNNEELQFSYRNSIFKNTLKDISVVAFIVYRLNKVPNLKTDYADVQKVIAEKSEDVTPEMLREIIVNIRQTKLHDPKKEGNAGSFFKNPIVEESKAIEIQKEFPELTLNFVGDDLVKLSAGWLIEQAGWKGWTSDDKNYGVSEKHALVLLNYSDANGGDIAQLSKDIKQSVYDKFEIKLEEEVIII